MPTTRLLGTKKSVDKTGILTIEAVFLADTEDDEISFYNSPPSLYGLPVTSANSEQNEDGTFLIYARHEGVSDGGSVGYENLDRTEIVFDGSMDKERIQAHPKFEQIKKLFGWDDENKMFPGTAQGQGGATGFNSDGGQGKPSELAGVDSYFEFGAEYSITYASHGIPGDVLRGIGTIHQPKGIEKINGAAPGTKRNFLKMGPRIVLRGNVFSITEKSLLSGPRGFSRYIYGEGQLEGDS